MKQFEILSGRCLVVELPETPFGTHVDGQHLLWAVRHRKKYKIFELPKGKWRIIGMLSEVTERQCRGLVDEAESGYRGYLPNSGFVYKGMAFGMSSFGYAWGSLVSAIFALGYVFNDPNEGDYDLSAFEAQSRVLCRERCLLLGRED